MIVSVVIPVYRAEKFVAKAVKSALEQPETGEVLLVEDCSPDGSLAVCLDLARKYGNVKVIQHPGGVNRGAGATRNLGIINARCDFVAFLDADDFYLPNRFQKAEELFERYCEVDGVYEAIGVHFYDPKAAEKFSNRKVKPIMTMRCRINSENLFAALARGKSGFFHLDGLVVKKAVFERCGYFFEHLRLHQDTAIIIQMSACGKLIPGRLDRPVAMRGVHDHNRILGEYNAFHTKFLLWHTLFIWALAKKWPTFRSKILFHNYCYSLIRLFGESWRNSRPDLMLMRSLFRELFKHPILTFCALGEYISRRPSKTEPR